MTSPHPGSDLSHVQDWIFDLDNTLYPLDGEFMGLIDKRMTAFVSRETGLPWDEARALQKRYLGEHGTTLAGLMARHGVEPHRFLDEVHDVPLDSLKPDPALASALARLPGRRLVFTNADDRHARRVLAHLGLDRLFDDIFHLESVGMVPKPQAVVYDRLIAAHAVTPRRAAFFEDSERNLAPAHALGMTTVLVGPHASACTAAFVDHRTLNLAAFLDAAQVEAAA